MAIRRAPITSAVFEFADELLVGKLLLFLEVSFVARNARKLNDELRVQAEKISDELTNIEHYQRQLTANVRVERLDADASFFNRIDGIIPFVKLSKPVCRTIARMELAAFRDREGFARRHIQLDF